MIIGLTGKNAAGKGELANYLKNKGFIYFSLSDALRDEATKQDLDHSRDNLIKLGTEMRVKFGKGILAVRINEKISELSGKDIVVDSIRHPGEIEELKKNDGFILIGVHTDAKIRFERLVKRGRVGDTQTFEEFLEHEKKRMPMKVQDSNLINASKWQIPLSIATGQLKKRIKILILIGIR